MNRERFLEEKSILPCVEFELKEWGEDFETESNRFLADLLKISQEVIEVHFDYNQSILDVRVYLDESSNNEERKIELTNWVTNWVENLING